MLKRHFDSLGLKRDERDDSKKDKGGDKEGDKNDDGFPAVHDCYMIYGGPSTQLTTRQRKRECREVFTARMAVLQYLSWSSTPITFDREDHPDKVVAPGVYPLVVDPIIVNTRLSKVLMDGGSSLNIIYRETLDLLGIDRGKLQPSAGGFHGVVPGKKALPVGRIDLPAAPFSWHDTMESAGAWLELRPVDVEKVEGLEVDDVQAAAAVYQHL